MLPDVQINSDNTSVTIASEFHYISVSAVEWPSFDAYFT